MVLGKRPLPGASYYLDKVGQGPTVLAVGAGGWFGYFFFRLSFFSLFSPSLWETAR